MFQVNFRLLGKKTKMWEKLRRSDVGGVGERVREDADRNLYLEHQVCKGSSADMQSLRSVGFMMQLPAQVKLHGNDDTSLPHLSSLFSPPRRQKRVAIRRLVPPPW